MEGSQREDTSENTSKSEVDGEGLAGPSIREGVIDRQQNSSRSMKSLCGAPPPVIVPGRQRQRSKSCGDVGEAQRQAAPARSTFVAASRNSDASSANEEAPLIFPSSEVSSFRPSSGSEEDASLEDDVHLLFGSDSLVLTPSSTPADLSQSPLAQALAIQSRRFSVSDPKFLDPAPLKNTQRPSNSRLSRPSSCKCCLVGTQPTHVGESPKVAEHETELRQGSRCQSTRTSTETPCTTGSHRASCLRRLSYSGRFSATWLQRTHAAEPPKVVHEIILGNDPTSESTTMISNGTWASSHCLSARHSLSPFRHSFASPPQHAQRKSHAESSPLKAVNETGLPHSSPFEESIVSARKKSTSVPSVVCARKNSNSSSTGDLNALQRAPAVSVTDRSHLWIGTISLGVLRFAVFVACFFTSIIFPTQAVCNRLLRAEWPS